MRKIVRERNTTALVTLHDPNLALQYCDDVVMIKSGKIVAAGPTAEIMSDDQLRHGLGENIRMDMTISGLPVVMPRYLDAYENTEQE
jgi:iron complex transport system ATP-binding protein